MCYSSHTDFFLKYLQVSNNLNRANHIKIVPERRETGLKGNILHRAIKNDFCKRKLLLPTVILFRLNFICKTAQKFGIF